MPNSSKKKDPRFWEKWRNSGAISTRNFNLQKHPEIRPGEVFLGNFDSSGFHFVCWKSKRRGLVALDILGRPLSQRAWPGAFPLFAKEEELLSAGVEIKYQPKMVRYLKQYS